MIIFYKIAIVIVRLDLNLLELDDLQLRIIIRAPVRNSKLRFPLLQKLLHTD